MSLTSRPADAAEFVKSLAGMNCSRHFDRQYGGDPEPGIESLLDPLDGGKETAESAEGKEATFGGHEDLISGNKGIDSENTQRRRTVYQNEVCPRLQRQQSAAQRLLPIRLCGELKLCSG